MADIEDGKLSEDQKKKKTRFKRIQSDKHRLYYASNTQVRGSFFDIRIIAGEIVQSDDDEAVFREDVSVVFSPQHAKAVSKLLKQQITDYEKKHGDIPTLEGSMTSPSIVDSQ